ncbi:hypothetical protein PQX77_014441 [Marasmius sp. AFHP31]|nr:hypothetical protein PQX77_014441 [Marasmius sp. AFHP31]
MPYSHSKGDTALNVNSGAGHQSNNNGAGTQNVAYSGGQVNFVDSFNTTTLNPHRSLWDKVAGVGASHTAEQRYERGVCLEGTREEVLRVIYDWIASIASKKCSLPICWLSGPAGVGKSAIAMTIARACEGKGLAASFFFSRSDPKRNNPSALVLTIAHGLVVNTRFTGASINQRISDDPSILEATLEDQFLELLLEPSLRGRWRKRQFAKVSPEFKEPNLVIINGLDECGDESAQRRILSTISSSYQRSPRSPLRFLICSRPEAWIQEAFEAEGLSRISECVVLDDRFMPDRDIERYYLHEFQLIREDRKYARVQFSTPWPSPRALKRLVQRTSGQFAYAVTTLRFIKLPHSSPITHLDLILNYTPEDRSSHSSLDTLDGLYRVILSVNPNRDKMLSILAAIFILPPHALPSPEFIELLFGLSAGDVDTALWSLHSVLNIRGGNLAIAVYHTSFPDFLHDPSRSREFYIDRATHHCALACQWLRAFARHVTANPHSVLTHAAPNVRPLFEEWVSFCLIDEHPPKELLIERNNLLRSILSVIADREGLLTRLASIILLPTYTPDPIQSYAFRNLILGPDAIEMVLRKCQLLAPGSKPEPFFLDFLLDPSQEYYIDLSEYRDHIARRWISALVPRNNPSAKQLRPGYYKWYVDFSTERIVDFTVFIHLKDGPVPPEVINYFEDFVEQQRVGFEEIPAGQRPSQLSYYGLDSLYHTMLSHANPDESKVSHILMAILILPGYMPPSPASLELVLGLSSDDVNLTLQSMHPVLDASGSDDGILLHSSFSDYLADRTRSRSFHVDLTTEEHTVAIARGWLQKLTTSEVRTYDSGQLRRMKTLSFLTEWMRFCTMMISEPTLGLLEDLRDVDFAYLRMWVGKYYHDPAIDPNKAACDNIPFEANVYSSYDNGQCGGVETHGHDLVEALLHKLREELLRVPNRFCITSPSASPSLSPS